MRRILMWAMSTLTVLVLLFGYHTSTSSRYPAAADSAAIAPVTGGDAADGGTAAAPPDSVSAPGAPDPASSSADAATVTGSVAQTRWGPVQVRLTLAGGRITEVSVVQYPHENGRDAQINARALPVLIDETISAQSAGIDMVSGATVTSEGYVESLQSALDQAGR